MANGKSARESGSNLLLSASVADPLQMQMPAIESAGPSPPSSSQNSSSGFPSRNSSYEGNLDALRTVAAPATGAEFGPPRGNKFAKEEIVDNPLAQLLSIRATINASPIGGPSMSSFPVLAHPALNLGTLRRLSSRPAGDSATHES